MSSVINEIRLTSQVILAPAEAPSRGFEAKFICRRAGEVVRQNCEGVEFFGVVKMRPINLDTQASLLTCLDDGALSVSLDGDTLRVIGLDADDMR